MHSKYFYPSDIYITITSNKKGGCDVALCVYKAKNVKIVYFS